MSAIRLDSLCIPLTDDQKVLFLLADNALRTVDVGGPLPALPPPWTGSLGTAGSIIVYDPGASSRGVNQLQLQELREYYWEIRTRPDGPPIAAISVSSSLEGSSRKRDWKPKRTSDSIHGTFKFINYLGGAWVSFQQEGAATIMPMVRFDVITAKLNYEIEYRAMVEAIASECQQLLLEWGSPTAVQISPDPEKQVQTLLEQFLFLRHVLGSENLELYLETLRRHPQTKLETERAWRPAATALPELFVRDPLMHGRDWRCAMSDDADLLYGSEALEIREERRFDSFDTQANRFVKFALKSFRTLCEDVMSARVGGRVLQEEQGAAWREANSMRDALDAFLGGPFFVNVGELHRIPFENQVLQKREGYREILHAWLMLDAAAQIDWPGRNDAYDGTNRDVATLYEYWLFFVLVRAFRERLGMKETRVPHGNSGRALPFCCAAEDGRMMINLKRGKPSFCQFEWQFGNARLRLHFFYNRQFDPSDINVRGTYSKGFRPDYSMVIIPAEFEDEEWEVAEQKAEAQGMIAYLHFDAKYRVENLAGVFGQSEAENTDEIGDAKATGTVKNVDLYKMHTYNEAIRRTVGSYVLYPGDDPKNQNGANRFIRYKEIVPGIGAFALKPRDNNKGEPEGLPFLLEFISDLLRHQASKFTQSYRISYWTETTIREAPLDFEVKTVDFPLGAKPPKDTHVLLGFVRDDESEKHCRESRTFFCHAVEWSKAFPRQPDGSGAPGAPTNLEFDPFRSDFLAVYRQNRSGAWIAAVDNVSLISAAERATELGRHLSEMHAAYYYRFQLKDFQPARERDVTALVSRRPGRPVACRLQEFASSPEA